MQSAFEYDYFKPCVICRQDVDEVVLKVEEMESVRLKDYPEMDQRDAASQICLAADLSQNQLPKQEVRLLMW